MVSSMTEITDPELIKQLNQKSGLALPENNESASGPITDPALLQQLNNKAGQQTDMNSLFPYMKPSNALDQLRSAVYGFGKAGAGIAKTFNPNAPEMPDIRSNNPSPVAEAFGSYAPFAIAGGPTLLGSTIGAGAYGATQYDPNQPGLIDSIMKEKFGMEPKGPGRVRNAIADMIANLALHGLTTSMTKPNTLPEFDYTPKFKFGTEESELTNIPWQKPPFLKTPEIPPLSDKIANELHHNITLGKNLEDAGKEVASNLNSAYEKVKGIHTKRYNDIFNAPTGEVSYQTGEPIRVNQTRIENSNYLKSANTDAIKDENLKLLHDQFNQTKSIMDAHKLQSEYGMEIGYLKRQKDKGLLDAAGKNELRDLAKAHEALKNDIRSGLNDIDPNLKNQYDATTASWKQHVVPYGSDKDLRAIASGDIKNPTTSQLIGIFKNPEENMNTIIGHMPIDVRDRIAHLGMGTGQYANSAKELLSGRESLEKKGLASYLNPYHEQNFRNLRNNVQMEEQLAQHQKANAKIEKDLKAAQKRAEQARVNIAAKRQENQNKTESEVQQMLKEKHKELAKEVDLAEKLKAKQYDQRMSIIKKIIGGTLAIGGIKHYGLEPKDMASGYIGDIMQQE